MLAFLLFFSFFLCKDCNKKKSYFQRRKLFHFELNVNFKNFQIMENRGTAFREIHKNTWLKRLTVDNKKITVGQGSKVCYVNYK